MKWPERERGAPHGATPQLWLDPSGRLEVSPDLVADADDRFETVCAELGILLARRVEPVSARVLPFGSEQLAMVELRDESTGSAQLHTATARGASPAAAVAGAAINAVTGGRNVLAAALPGAIAEGKVRAAVVFGDGEAPVRWGLGADEGRLAALYAVVPHLGSFTATTGNDTYRVLRLPGIGVALVSEGPSAAAWVEGWFAALLHATQLALRATRATSDLVAPDRGAPSPTGASGAVLSTLEEQCDLILAAAEDQARQIRAAAEHDAMRIAARVQGAARGDGTGADHGVPDSHSVGGSTERLDVDPSRSAAEQRRTTQEAALEHERSAARAATERARAAEGELERLRTEVEEAARERETATIEHTRDLRRDSETMLREAERARATIVADAQREAQGVLRDAERTRSETLAETKREIAGLLRDAERTRATVLGEAARQSDEVLRDADRTRAATLADARRESEAMLRDAERARSTLLSDARRESEELLREADRTRRAMDDARRDVERLQRDALSGSRDEADQLLREARAQSERIVREARSVADDVVRDAHRHADQLTNDAAASGLLAPGAFRRTPVVDPIGRPANSAVVARDETSGDTPDAAVAVLGAIAESMRALTAMLESGAVQRGGSGAAAGPDSTWHGATRRDRMAPEDLPGLFYGA